MTMKRRAFLKNTSASFLAASSLGGLVSTLSGINAHAANTDGYKALVCVFLYGGMDNHDTIIPYDTPSYNRWADIRASLLQTHGASRARSSLLQLPVSNPGNFGSRQFALPPEFSGLHQLFSSGNLSVIGNVGPMIEPVSRTTFEDESVRVPSRLFSHNDQQSTWMSGAPEGARFGWAGMFSDLMIQANANSSKTFTTMTTGGTELLITGQQAVPYHIEGGMAPEFEMVEDGDELRKLLRQHVKASKYKSKSLLQKDMALASRRAYNTNRSFNRAISGAPTLQSVFPESELGNQLSSVANSIAIRDQLGVSRQIYVVSMGGFDTHSSQATALPLLQSQMDAAIVSFYQAMVELGVSNDIILFTASDFGRTLAINGDGTDHGWAGHHFVVGGSVRGAEIVGDIPEAELGHDLDAGSGRLIPTLSTDQYAAALGTWFGLAESDLSALFPDMQNLGSPPTITV